MILITAPVFGDLTSLNEQLPEVVRMARGATVPNKDRADFPPVLESDHTMRATQHRRRNSAGADALAPIAACSGRAHRRASVAQETAAGASFGPDPSASVV